MNKHDPNYNSYWYTRIPPNSPYYPMTYNGSIAEHRLVMAQHLGRCLKPTEIVHHLNSKKNDNRIENLTMIEGGGTHVSIHRLIKSAGNALTET